MTYDNSSTPRSDSLRAEATQVAHPGIATLRTIVQTAIPSVIGLVFILPLILQEVVEGMGDQLPDGLRLWLLAAAGFVTAVAGTLARIFAIPGVNEALRGVGLKAPDTQVTDQR